MKVLCFGAGGIIGQHLMQSTPEDLQVIYCRTNTDNIYTGIDITEEIQLMRLLSSEMPDVVINLAGENRVDVVEQDPDAYFEVNVAAAIKIAQLCTSIGTHLIHVSTQGVFSGDNPPYNIDSQPNPITEYGRQKAAAEVGVLATEVNTIARVTFVLGIRPNPNIGRPNPLEQMFEQNHQFQVNDRWFSPAFANDVADQLWKLVYSKPGGIVHIGEPIRMTRYNIACSAIHDTYRSDPPKIQPVSHDYFPGIAPRPKDTTWAYGSMYTNKYDVNILEAYLQWKRRENGSGY